MKRVAAPLFLALAAQVISAQEDAEYDPEYLEWEDWRHDMADESGDGWAYPERASDRKDPEQMRCQELCLMNSIPTCSAAGCACWEPSEQELFFCCVEEKCGHDILSLAVQTQSVMCNQMYSAYSSIAAEESATDIGMAPFTFQTANVCTSGPWTKASVPPDDPTDMEYLPEPTSSEAFDFASSETVLAKSTHNKASVSEFPEAITTASAMSQAFTPTTLSEGSQITPAEQVPQPTDSGALRGRFFWSSSLGLSALSVFLIW